MSENMPQFPYENDDQNENRNEINMETFRPPNYGKTPAYIQKFKEEEKQKAAAKQEAKDAKKRPPGTKVISEDERIETLESLQKQKDELMKMLMKLPLTLATESLK